MVEISIFFDFRPFWVPKWLQHGSPKIAQNRPKTWKIDVKSAKAHIAVQNCPQTLKILQNGSNMAPQNSPKIEEKPGKLCEIRQSPHRIPKLSTDPENPTEISKSSCQNHAKILSNSYDNHASVMPKSSKNHTKIMPKSPEHHTKSLQTSYHIPANAGQHLAEIIPKSYQIHTKFIPKSYQNHTIKMMPKSHEKPAIVIAREGQNSYQIDSSQVIDKPTIEPLCTQLAFNNW